ncbi:hypothetical protein [Streptomyces geranii]|uniref:hypothetical protein n=1 Tax=Streptomyces geranii TaxID=2058923 RepID=UPI000D02E236|nr:hypothetical protein [Streptomyces geranii]
MHANAFTADAQVDDRTDHCGAACVDGRLHFTMDVVEAVGLTDGAHRVGISLSALFAMNDAPAAARSDEIGTIGSA